MEEGYKRRNRRLTGRISPEKLNEPFKRTDLLDLQYIEHAKNVALRMKKGEYVHPDEIIDIRLDAVNDRKNLKGDFVISVFLELIEQGVKFERWEKGKSIRVNADLAKRIFENEVTKKLSVTEFCKENQLTRNKYYRIANCDVKNAEKKAELEEIKANVIKSLQNSI